MDKKQQEIIKQAIRDNNMYDGTVRIDKHGTVSITDGRREVIIPYTNAIEGKVVKK